MTFGRYAAFGPAFSPIRRHDQVPLLHLTREAGPSTRMATTSATGGALLERWVQQALQGLYPFAILALA